MSDSCQNVYANIVLSSLQLVGTILYIIMYLKKERKKTDTLVKIKKKVKSLIIQKTQQELPTSNKIKSSDENIKSSEEVIMPSIDIKMKDFETKKSIGTPKFQ